MPEQSSYLADPDFETIYQGGSPLGGTLPWDIGKPQPQVVTLDDAGEIRGEVLEVGCGPGDNATFLASRGHRVTGVDIAPSAIAEARRRAGERGVELEFTVADATTLDGFDARFDTILDSALYHCLTEDARPAYTAALHRCGRPGATLHLFCFSEHLPEGFPAPFQISERELRETIGRMWTITRLELTDYETAVTPDGLRLAASRIQPDQPIDAAAFDTMKLDDHGRVMVPVWRLTAERAG